MILPLGLCPEVKFLYSQRVFKLRISFFSNVTIAHGILNLLTMKIVELKCTAISIKK
jgi:hypothetical protein